MLPQRERCSTMARKIYTMDFKREAAELVLGQGYGVREACEAMGVSATAMRRWVSWVATRINWTHIWS